MNLPAVSNLLGNKSAMSTVGKFIHDSVRSRTAWLLVCLHAAWFLLAIANMSPPAPGLAKFFDRGGGSSATVFAGRPFHFTYESMFLKALLLVDMPSMLASVPFDFLLLAPVEKALHVKTFAGSYVDAIVLLIIASCQWLVIGSFIDTRLKSFSWGRRGLQRFDRYFIVVIALVLLFTVITVPIVNKRSQRLGFRHGGISFY